MYLSTSNEAVFCLHGKKASSYWCVYRVSLSNSSVCVCVAFDVFVDYESCTVPIPTNPGSMEADVYGLTRGTYFVASRLEVVAVAALLSISWCVFGAAGFRFFPFFFLCAHSACCKHEAALPHPPL